MTGLGAEPHGRAREGPQAALALTELDEDILGLIKRHLLEGLPHQNFNGPCVPVFGRLRAHQVGLWGQPGWPQPGLSGARAP